MVLFLIQNIRFVLRNHPRYAWIFYGIVVFLCSFFTYRRLFFTYFQQDEWYYFAQALYAREYGFNHIFQVLGTYHFTPASTMFLFFQYFVFGREVQWWALTSIVFHSLTSILVAIFGYSISKKYSVAWLSGLYFAASYSHHQAVSWFAASSSIGALLFSILAILYARKNNLIRLIITLFLALLWKEDAIVLLVILPLLYTYDIHVGWKLFLRRFWLLYGMAFIYIIVRLSYQHGDRVAPISILDNPYLLRNITVFLTTPGFTVFSPDVIRETIKYFHTPQSIWEAWVIGRVMTVIGASFVSIGVWCLCWCQKKVRKTLITLLACASFSLVPYILVLGNDISVPDSRYLYMPQAFMAIVISWLFVRGVQAGWLIRGITCVGIVLIYVVSFFFFRSMMFMQMMLGATRQKAVETVASTIRPDEVHPVYLVHATGLPFQIGVGYTFLVLHAEQNGDFTAYIPDDYLVDLYSQGYKKMGSTSFGFFTDSNKLIASDIPNDMQVKVFTFSSETGLLRYDGLFPLSFFREGKM